MWERRLVEARRDQEMLGWNAEGTGELGTTEDLGGLTQEVVALLCTNEEITSRQEELETTGEIKKMDLSREQVRLICLMDTLCMKERS
jgi:hypothetical protein